MSRLPASWRAPRSGGLLALALLVAVLPVLLPNAFYTDVATKIFLNAIVCIGLNLLVGYAGQISLGHAGFYALGAYGSAVLTSALKWPGWLALPAAACGVGALAFVVARPILKLKGHYLAMATLGLGIIIAIVINREIWLTGGPDGMTVPALSLFGMRLVGGALWYGIAGAAMLVAVALALNLVESPPGRALRALHGSEVAAEAIGIDATRHKVMVFVLSAVFASVAGSLYAHADRFVTPAEAGFLRSVEFVTMIVLGGLASTWGAVVGAALLTLLPQLLAGLAEYEHILFGLILMGTMIFLPRGIVPSLAARWGR